MAAAADAFARHTTLFGTAVRGEAVDVTALQACCAAMHASISGSRSSWRSRMVSGTTMCARSRALVGQTYRGRDSVGYASGLVAVELVGMEQQNSGVCFAALRLVQVHHLEGLRTAGVGPDERPSAERRSSSKLRATW